MNNELSKNAEGYMDPTAAATLNRKESADIWEYKGGECLIIKGHPGFATILRLHDSDKYGDRVKVTDRDDGPRYFDPAFIISGRYSEMGAYVETLDAATFEKVISAVETALQIDLLTRKAPAEPSDTDGPANGGQLLKLQEENGELRRQLDEIEEIATDNAQELDRRTKQLTDARERMEVLEHLANIKNAESTAANNAANKARNQLELLREMYNDLLAKVVGGGE